MPPRDRVSPHERHLRLLLQLQDARQPLTSEEIFAEVEGYRGEERSPALEKRFERDRQILADAGIEITTVPDPTAPGDRARWRYELATTDAGSRTLQLSALETLLVAQATNVWDRSGLADEARRAYLKLASTGEVDDRVRESVRRATLTTDPAFSALHRAVIGRRTVEFDYVRAGETAAHRRHVDPLQLVVVDGRWLCNAFDLDRGAERNFLVRRILGEVTDVGERISGAEATTDLPAVLAEHAARTPVRLAVRPGSDAEVRLRRRSVAEHAPQDGWPVLELHDWDHELLADELASLGGQLRILEPAALVDAVLTRFDRILAALEETA